MTVLSTAEREAMERARVAELERERDTIKRAWEVDKELGWTTPNALEAAEQRERVLREALGKIIAEVDRLRGPHADPLGILDATATQALVEARAALAGSPEQADETSTEMVELPRDLVQVLRDPNIIVVQDAKVFELLAKWQQAPAATESGTERPEDELSRSAVRSSTTTTSLIDGSSDRKDSR